MTQGDLVRLKSGGPLMTVIGTVGDLIKCLWFVCQGTTETARGRQPIWDGPAESVFPRDALEIIKPRPLGGLYR